jgi:membrane protein required for colicin V production
LNSLDIIISVIVLVGIVRGFIKGFIYEIALLGSIIICYFLGFKLADIIANYLVKWISTNPLTTHLISVLMAWIGISVAIFFLARLFEGLVNIAALGIFNKIAGAIFGGIKYVLLLSLFLFFFNRIDFNMSWLNADKKAESQLYYPVLKVSTMIFSVLKN